MRKPWERLYRRHRLQYGGSYDLGLLEPHLRPGMLVLDAGCGDGKTAELLTRTCEVVACDFSRDALLSMRSQRNLYGRAYMVECNILSLPFDDKMFDVILCVHVLSHMLEDERVRAARELERTAKAGGYLFVEGFGRSDLRYGRGEEIEPFTFARKNGIATHFFTEGEIPSLFPRLELVQEVRVQRRAVFGSVSGKRDYVRVLLRKA